MRLYHTGFAEIREPDVRRGRKNADFGQGFYLSGSEEFSRRWAGERKGESTWLNAYELTTDGLRVKRFSRDAAWFAYIFRNRAGYEDALADWDVVIGPIANDTIYDTWGVLTSGVLEPEQAMQLLQIGPLYEQIVVKSERAASQLRFLGARVLTGEELATCRETLREEEEAYQIAFSERMSRLLAQAESTEEERRT